MKRQNISRRLSLDVINEKLKSMGLYLVNSYLDKPITEGRFAVRDEIGYCYMVYWTSIYKGHMPEKYHPNNPYTIQNINLFLKLERDGEYECISSNYERNNLPLEFKHKKCGNVFVSTLTAMQGKKIGLTSDKYYKNCPKCYRLAYESHHASTLKQIFMHEYPDTSIEDKSCINPNTNYPLPTDIVNHRLKLAIEIQSSWHDEKSKKELDQIKSKYWIDRGYSFYSLDIRDCSIIDMIQCFFPHIHQIPSYVDMHFADKLDYKKIQSLLDSGKTVKETASILNIPTYRIHNIIYSGMVELPLESKRKAGQQKSLVCLSPNGDFIKAYDCLNYVAYDNYALGTIQRVLRHEQKYAYGMYWVYGDDYYNNHYTLPEIESDRYLQEITLINDETSETIKCNDMYDAAEIAKCYPCDIYRVFRGKRKSIHGYYIA